jgi:hypothetical protein
MIVSGAFGGSVVVRREARPQMSSELEHEPLPGRVFRS